MPALALSACGGGAGGAVGPFCEEASEQVEAFQGASGRVSPTFVGTLRDLAGQAPDELVDEFETVTESSNEGELDRALAGIEEFLAEECDLDVRA